MLQGRWFNRGKATAKPVVWASSELKTRGSGNDDTSQPYKVVVVVVVVVVAVVIVVIVVMRDTWTEALAMPCHAMPMP